MTHDETSKFTKFDAILHYRSQEGRKWRHQSIQRPRGGNAKSAAMGRSRLELLLIGTKRYQASVHGGEVHWKLSCEEKRIENDPKKRSGKILTPKAHSYM